MDGEGKVIRLPMKRQDSKSCGLLLTSISFPLLQITGYKYNKVKKELIKIKKA